MAKKYLGRKSTIELYKKEKAAFQKRVKALEQWGVKVPEYNLPKPGEKVTMPVVRWLQSMTREKIAKQSTINVDTGMREIPDVRGRRVVPVTETYRGKDVLRIVKKKVVRHGRELREKRQRNRYYVDPDTGLTFDSKTGEVVENEAYDKWKKKNDWVDTQIPSVDTGKLPDAVIPEVDIDDTGYKDSTSFSDEYLSRWMSTLGNYMADTWDEYPSMPGYVNMTDESAHLIQSYINQAIDAYGVDGVVSVLQGMDADGIEITPKILYDEEAFDAYWGVLISRLPLNNRYDYDLNRNE